MPQRINWKFMFLSADGRINRQLWWIGIIIVFLVAILSTALFGRDGLVPFVIGIALMIASLCLHIKRCHDRDKSGWWCLLLFIPFIGTIWMIIDLGLLEGTKGGNRFGADPLEQFQS